MKTINISKAKPGMVLGREVVNRDGRRLFDAGIVLSEKMIRTLKMWGILEVTIPTDTIPEDLPPPNAPPGRTRLDNGKKKAVLAHHFRHNDLENSVIKDIYALSFERIETCPEVLSFLQEPSKKGPGKSDVHDPYPVNGIHSLLADEIKLPALPTIFSQINAAIKNPSCSGKDIAEIVSKDTSLSATILKIVNSAYYGFDEPVESLAYAAMVLGSQQVCSLALGITVINYFKGLPGNRINMQSFWRHSVACGITAQILASHVEKVNKERVFIGGLLHDIGQLVFLCYYPGTAGIAFGQAEKLGLFPHQVEPRYFGMTHAVFGSLMADKWNFSAHISAQIRHHHDDFKEKPPREIAIVYVSNWLVNAVGIGSSSRYNLPRLNMNAWQALGITHRVLEPVIRQLDRQLVEAIKFFYE